MAEVKIKDGKAPCPKCGKDVAVSEREGDPNREEKARVLVCEKNHVIGER